MNHTNIEIEQEYSEAEQNCKGCFGPCGMCAPLDTFLHVNADELGPDARQEIDAAIAALVRDYLAPIRLNACPEYLQDALRRLVTQAAYEVRNAGKKVDPRAEYMETQGTAKSSILNPCRR